MEDGGSQSQQNSNSNPFSESILLSDNPDATSQQSTPSTSDSQLSQSQPSPFSLGSAPKSYHTLSHEECLLMVSDSIKSIIMNTFNDAFRKQCYELLEVDSSEEAGQKFSKLLEAIVKPNDNNSSLVLPLLTDSPSGDSVEIFSNDDNVWAIPPTPGASQETSESPDFASFGNDFEVERTASDPCSGLDYYALAESINDILTQSEAIQLPNLSEIQSQDSPNHEVLAETFGNSQVVENEQPIIHVNQNVDADQPSPSLLQNVNDSETVITHDDEEQVAIADEPSQNGQRLVESQSQDSWNKWATPIQLEENSENPSESHTPENLEVREKDLPNLSNGSQNLAEEVVFLDTDHPVQGKQKKPRHASRESELSSKTPLRPIQNMLHLTPRTPTREQLLLSFRSIRP